MFFDQPVEQEEEEPQEQVVPFKLFEGEWEDPVALKVSYKYEIIDGQL